MSRWAPVSVGRMWHSEEHKAQLALAQKNQIDPHTHVAAWFYRVSPEKVTSEQRYFAKNQNYIHLYQFGRAR